MALFVAPGLPLDRIDEDLSKSWRRSSQSSASEQEGAHAGSQAHSPMSPVSPGEHGFEEDDPMAMTMKLPPGQSWMSHALEESTRLAIERGTYREAAAGRELEEEDSGDGEGMLEEGEEGEALRDEVLDFCAMMLERRLPVLIGNILEKIRTAAPAGRAAKPRPRAGGGSSRDAASPQAERQRPPQRAEAQAEAQFRPIRDGMGAGAAGAGSGWGGLEFPADGASVDDFLDGIHRQLSDDESRRRQKNTEAIKALDDSLKELSSAREKLSSSPDPLHKASPLAEAEAEGEHSDEEQDGHGPMPHEHAAEAASSDPRDDDEAQRRTLRSPPLEAYKPRVSPPQLVLTPGSPEEASGLRRTLKMPPAETGSLHGVLAELPVEPGSDASSSTEGGEETDGEDKGVAGGEEGGHSPDGAYVSDGGHAYEGHDIEGDAHGEEVYYYESEGGGMYVEGQGRVEGSGEEDCGDASAEEGGAVYLDDDELEEGVYESDGGGVYIVGAGRGLATCSEEGSFEVREEERSPGSGDADSSEEYADVERRGVGGHLGNSGGVARVEGRGLHVEGDAEHGYAPDSAEEEGDDASAEESGVVYLDDDELEEGVYESDGGGVYIVGAGRGLATCSEEGSFEVREEERSPGSGAADSSEEYADVETGVGVRRGGGGAQGEAAQRRGKERDLLQSDEGEREEEVPYVHGAYESGEEDVYMSDGGTLYVYEGGGEADEESYVVGSGEEDYYKSGEDPEERNNDAGDEDVEEEVYESDGGNLYLRTVRRSKKSAAQGAGRGVPIDDQGDERVPSPSNRGGDEYESAGGATHVIWDRGSKECGSHDEDYGSQSPGRGESSDNHSVSAHPSSVPRRDDAGVPSDSLGRPSSASRKAAVPVGSAEIPKPRSAGKSTGTAAPLGRSQDATKQEGGHVPQRERVVGGEQEGFEYESAGGGRHTMWDRSGGTPTSSAEAHESTSPPPSESDTNSDVKRGTADVRKYVDVRRDALTRAAPKKTDPKRAHVARPKSSPPGDAKRSPPSAKDAVLVRKAPHDVINDHRKDGKHKPSRRNLGHGAHVSPPVAERGEQADQRAVSGGKKDSSRLLRERTPDSLDGDEYAEGDFAEDVARTPDSLEAGADDDWAIEREEEDGAEMYEAADEGALDTGAFDRTPSAVSFDLSQPDEVAHPVAAYRSERVAARARAASARGRLATKEGGRWATDGTARTLQSTAPAILRRDPNRPSLRGAAGASPGARVASPARRAASPPAAAHKVDARVTEAFLIASRAPRRAPGRIGAATSATAPLRGTRGSPQRGDEARPGTRRAAVPARRAGAALRGVQEHAERRPAPRRPKSAPASRAGHVSGASSVPLARAAVRRRAWG